MSNERIDAMKQLAEILDPEFGSRKRKNRKSVIYKNQKSGLIILINIISELGEKGRHAIEELTGQKFTRDGFIDANGTSWTDPAVEWMRLIKRIKALEEELLKVDPPE